MRILVTGAAGFIAGHLVPELLGAGHEVVGVDDGSRYGAVPAPRGDDPRYRLVRGDASDPALLRELATDCDALVAAAARIGGVAWLRAHPYEILAENKRLTFAAFEAARWAHANRRLRRIVVISSSLVYESTTEFPTPEGAELRCPPPRSAYGIQKLALEAFARSARAQHGLPYAIARPFNVVGVVGPRDPAAAPPDPHAAPLNHVVPDLVRKIVRGEDPVRLLGGGRTVRHFTWAGDLARGLRLCAEHPAAEDEDFNLSTARGHTVLQVAQAIWRILRPSDPFRWAEDPAPERDLARSVPSVEKARRLLGFEATTTLERALAEVVPWAAARVAREPR